MSNPSYSTVLVGTDGSESSFRAVDRAAAVARDAGASLLLVCAYRSKAPSNDPSSGDYGIAGPSLAEGVLHGAAARAKAAGVPEAETFGIEGDPVDALVKVIEQRKVDLIVVGNRGLNSLAGRLLGSVPANVSHRAPCDVLIVHTTGRGAK
ncbi:MAG TPA: universal stress protein [Mycobacteriales bacterium]|nr:universal stress protein [Mycobacteriales bacterium]